MPHHKAVAHNSLLTRRCASAALGFAACLFLAGPASVPVLAQPSLVLPAGAIPPCPTSGTPSAPCVTLAPSLYPGYFTVTFQGIPSGYSIINGTYVGWCADLFGPFHPTQSYVLFSSYGTLPAGLTSTWWPAVNWLLNHKPTSIVADSGQTVTDPKTLRDVIQQTIWELLDPGPFNHYCCSVGPPNATIYATQYNGSAGGISIVNAINSLYAQAVGQTGFVPGPGQVIAVVMEADGTLAYSNDDLQQDTLFEILVPNTPGCYTTVTQGGWGAPPQKNNPAGILAANFSTVFPSGVVIGGTYTLKFTSSGAIKSFLPAKGGPAALTASYVDTTNSFVAGEFAGQVLALTLSVNFSAAGVYKQGLGNLTVNSGPLAGSTVNQVLAAANIALGGGALPPGVSLSTLNSLLDKINKAFDNGACPAALP
jgi:hypothetical protein